MTSRHHLHHGLRVVAAAALLGIVGAGSAAADGATPTPGPTSPSPTASPTTPPAPAPTPSPSPDTSPSAAPSPSPSPSPTAPVPSSTTAARVSAAAADPADARVTLAAAGEVAPGGSFTIEAYADLVSGAATAVVLTVDLPAGVAYVPADPHSSVGQSCTAAGQVVTCRDETPDVGGGTSAGGFLRFGASADLTPGTPLTFSARAAVEGAEDPEPGNDEATGSVAVVAERNVGISWDPVEYTAQPSDELQLSLTVVNHGATAVKTFVTVIDPVYADGTTGLPETYFTTFPTDQPGRTCFGDKGAVLCDFTLAAGERVVVDYRVRVDPADAGHVLGVRASSKTGSVDATAADDVSVARIVVADAPDAAPPSSEPGVSAAGPELAATGTDRRTAVLLTALGLLLVAAGSTALRYSTRA